MSIIRSPKLDRFFYVLDKKISEDRRLSWQARGLLVYLLGKPDNWKVSVEALKLETVESRKPTSRDGVYSIMDELSAAGYVKRVPARHENGRMAGFDYLVQETPLPDYPLTAEPLTAQATLISTDIKQELKSTKTSSPKRLSDDTFELFWKIYPKKVSKADALKAWKKIDVSLLEKIMVALSAHSCCEQWVKDSGQFIPNAATWLNKQKWEDEVKPYVAGQPNTGTGGQSRPSLVDRVRQANAHLFDDEPPAYVDDREWPEFECLREVDGQVVGSDDGDVRP